MTDLQIASVKINLPEVQFTEETNQPVEEGDEKAK